MDDSDNEDDRTSNKFSKSKDKETKPKKRRIIVSSDEDEPKTSNGKGEAISSKLAKLSTKSPNEKKMKPINVSNVFGNDPVKRVEKEKKAKKSEKDIFDEDTDEMEMMNIDEELLSSKTSKASPQKEKKVKEEKQTPKKDPSVLKAKDNIKTPPKVKIEKKTPDDSKKVKKEQKSSDDESQKSKKRNGTPASNKKPPKQSNDDPELDRSVYDPDQEKHERRRAAAMLYKQMQKRSGPANPGSKEIPKGKPNCLAGLKFVLTGVYDSMERDEAASVIKELGGSVTSAISGKTNYVVAGEESGPAKLAKAEDMNIPVLTEDELLDLIREKSGIPTLKSKKPEVKKESPIKKASKPSPKEQPIKKEKHTHSPSKHESPKKMKIDDEQPGPSGMCIHYLSD